MKRELNNYLILKQKLTALVNEINFETIPAPLDEQTKQLNLKSIFDILNLVESSIQILQTMSEEE